MLKRHATLSCQSRGWCLQLGTLDARTGSGLCLSTQGQHSFCKELAAKYDSSSLFAMQVRQAGSGQPQVPALEGLGTPRMALQDGQGQVGVDSCTNRA